jgi:hypothetical protein
MAYTNVHGYQASANTFMAIPTCSLSPNQPASRVRLCYPDLLSAGIGLEMSCWYSVNWTFRCQDQRLCEESEVTKVLRPDGHYEISDFWPLVLQRV